jgi:ligand-binding sensor domain-containing protein
MKKFTILLFVYLFLFINQANSQTFTNYTIANTSTTLCNNKVNAIATDSEGNKWFGTDEGVSKFDGTNWTTYDTLDGLASNYVRAIAIDSEGNKWFGTEYYNSSDGHYYGVISKFDGTNWTAYDTVPSFDPGIISAIAIDTSGNIWITAIVTSCDTSDLQLICNYSCHLIKFDGTARTDYTLEPWGYGNFINALAIDAEGNKWFGTGGWHDLYGEYGGVTKFNDTTWTTYTPADGLADNYVYAIAVDADGNKWFGTGGGVSKFDDSTWTTYTTKDGLAENRVTAIAIDAEGNKWFAEGGEVSKFDGTNCTNYNASDGLPGNLITAIAIDAEGNKWFGWSDYLEGGVSKFDDSTWTTYTPSGGLADNRIKAIAIDAEGNKWFGTDNGVSKFDGTNWITYTTADGLIDNRIQAIAIDAEGNKWFGTDNGVSKFDGTNWTNYNTSNGLAGNSVYSIAIDAEGNKWFGTYGGVSKFDDSTWTTYYTSDGSFGYYDINIVIDVDNNIWITRTTGEDCGTTEVSKFDGNNWTTYDTLNLDFINSIAVDTGNNIWIARDSGFHYLFDPYCGRNHIGVIKFNRTNFETTYYTTSDGLVNDYVHAIVIDAEGNKWFGCGSNEDWQYIGGVSKFDGNTWTTYTTSDGLVNYYVNAIAIDAEGNKWFGTDGGVSKLSDEGTTYILSISPSNQNVGFDAGNTTFNISSNTIWSISDDADWLEVSPTSGSGDGTITASYTANTLVTSKVATITISGTGVNSQFVTVTQIPTFVPSLYDLKAIIYPNPADDMINIEISNTGEEKIVVELLTVSGQVIYRKEYKNSRDPLVKQIDLSGYAKGVYFVRIRQSGAIYNGKIIVM